MASATAYLGLAGVFALRATPLASLNTTRAELADLVEKKYSWKIDDDVAEKMLRQLQAWGCVTIIEDKYAGETVRGFAATQDRALKAISDAGYGDLVAKANFGGDDWFQRVFSNQIFWDDLYKEDALISETDNQSEIDEPIPAADRTVTLEHNQYVQIEKPTTDLITALEEDNGLPDEPGFRERILGHLKAGRELLRAGVFSLDVFRMTMIVGLRLLVERYREHAIGAAASALLTLLLNQLGIPGF